MLQKRMGTLLLFVTTILLLIGCGSSENESDFPISSNVVWAVGNADAEGNTAIYYSYNNGVNWSRVDSNTSIPSGIDANDLFVVTANEVWIVGSKETLLHTTDAGKTWKTFKTLPDYNSSISLYSISGTSSEDFWISGDDGTVYHTKDSALHWDKIDPAIFHHGLVQGIKVIDRLTIYAVGKPADSGGGFVSRSLDGGETWEDLTSSDIDNNNEWIGVKATDKNHIVIYGQQGHYASTSDGGTTWTNGYIEASGGVDGADINDLVMVDTMYWWSAMDLDNIFLTNDGGSHWQKQLSSGQQNMYLVGIDALDREHAVIVGRTAGGYPSSGKILITQDGGTSWKQQLLTSFPLSKVSFIDIENSTTNEEEKSMFASLINGAIASFINSASGTLGSDVMGLILQKIGWGIPENTTDNKILTDMNEKLDEISADLKNIETQLEQDVKKIEMELDKLDTDVNYPKKEISTIYTINDDFKNSFLGKKAGEVEKSYILWFVKNKIYANDMETQINGISMVLDPGYYNGGSTALLESLRKTLSTKYDLGYFETIKDTFDMFETYTSRILYNQLEGVNLLIEALHVDSNESGRCPSPEDNNTCVLNYMDEYTRFLKDVVENKERQGSYAHNIYRLALDHINPLPILSNNTLFPTDTETSLQRANFYRKILTNNKSIYPSIVVIATQDISDNVETSFNLCLDYFNFDEFDCNKSVSIPGKTYDYWEGNKIKPSSQYDVYECFLSDSIKPGIYNIYNKCPVETSDIEDFSSIKKSYVIYSNNDTDQTTLPQTTPPEVLGKIQIDSYDKNYILGNDGNYTYGQTLFFQRSTANHFTADSTEWQYTISDMKCTKWEGTIPWESGIEGPYDCNTRGFEGTLEVYTDFDYTGKDQTLNIAYDALFSIDIQNAYYGDEASLSVDFGIWDVTDNSEVSNFYHYSKDADVGSNLNEQINPNGICSFEAKESHTYRIYFKMKVNGLSSYYDETHAKINLDQINHIYLYF